MVACFGVGALPARPPGLEAPSPTCRPINTHQPKPWPAVAATMLDYLHTDSALCLFGDGTPMADAHDDAFRPVVAWAGVRYGTPFVASQSIRGADQSPAAVAAVQDHLLGEG